MAFALTHLRLHNYYHETLDFVFVLSAPKLRLVIVFRELLRQKYVSRIHGLSHISCHMGLVFRAVFGFFFTFSIECLSQVLPFLLEDRFVSDADQFDL